MPLCVDLKLAKGDFNLQAKFQVDQQQVVGVMGPSASGKTTLLRCLAGLEKAQGTISMGNQEWQGPGHFIKTEQRSLGVIFQEDNLFPHLSVKQNLEFALNRKGVALQGAIEQFGVGHLLSRRPHTLSGGESQRVALARVVSRMPALILMDEPLSKVDHQSKFSLLELIVTIPKIFPTTILYVSHSPEEIQFLAQEGLALKNGRVSKVSDVADGILEGTQVGGLRSLIKGTVDFIDEEDVLGKVDIGSQTVHIPSGTQRSGQSVALAIDGSDVLLGLTKHDDSSCLNILRVTVVKWWSVGDGLINIRLDLEGQTLYSTISKRSFAKLSIHEGQNLFASFKATAIVSLA